jgi:hypothetical protein
MKPSRVILLLAVVVISRATAYADETIPELAPYALPVEIKSALTLFAGESDVLILGEVHGTREVPGIVVALLDDLAKLGYTTIALEVPRDQQTAIEDWGVGDTDVLPPFFGNPGADGRGNREALAMVRRALRPPYNWTLICFDETEAEMASLVSERQLNNAKVKSVETDAPLSPDDIVSLSRTRDAAMARYLESGRRKLAAGAKILAISGNLHARTASRVPASHPLAAFWPSFAANLAGYDPKLQVRSMNIQAFGGEYFNEGKVQSFSPRRMERVKFARTRKSDWDAELDLPTASAATFVQPPKDAGD